MGLPQALFYIFEITLRPSFLIHRVLTAQEANRLTDVLLTVDAT